MSIINRIQESLPDFSRTERRVADYILLYPQSIERLSSEALSAACEASRGAVVRLCQKLGYQGYADFKAAFLAEGPYTTAAKVADSSLSTHDTENAIRYYCNGFLQMEGLLNTPAFETMIDLLAQSKRVIALGLNHSDFSARQLAFRLIKLGIDCSDLSDSTIMASYEQVLGEGDTAVIFSISGRSVYKSFSDEFRAHGAHVILLTMNPDCELFDAVDVALALPHLSSAAGHYAMDDAVTYYLFIETIVEALSARR